eukprot:5976738-Amphidinium_carterae.2
MGQRRQAHNINIGQSDNGGDRASSTSSTATRIATATVTTSRQWPAISDIFGQFDNLRGHAQWHSTGQFQQLIWRTQLSPQLMLPNGEDNRTGSTISKVAALTFVANATPVPRDNFIPTQAAV